MAPYMVINKQADLETIQYVTRFAKTRHNSTFIEIHFIAPSRFGH